MIYFITFSEIVKSFFQDALGLNDASDVDGFKWLLIQKGTWVVVLAISMLPLIVQKEL
jgi:amino acid permease